MHAAAAIAPMIAELVPNLEQRDARGLGWQQSSIDAAHHRIDAMAGE